MLLEPYLVSIFKGLMRQIMYRNLTRYIFKWRKSSFFKEVRGSVHRGRITRDENWMLWKGQNKKVRRFSDHFTMISSHLFDNYLNIFHKTEDKNGHFVVLNRSKSWLVQKLWHKTQRRQKTVGPLQSSQFSSLVFLPLWLLLEKKEDFLKDIWRHLYSCWSQALDTTQVMHQNLDSIPANTVFPLMEFYFSIIIE